jgi:hypothetical protein
MGDRIDSGGSLTGATEWPGITADWGTATYSGATPYGGDRDFWRGYPSLG